VESFRGSLLYADFLIALSLKIGNHTGPQALRFLVHVQLRRARSHWYQIEQGHGSVWNEVTSALVEKFELKFFSFCVSTAVRGVFGGTDLLA
jgi:hypothetical protein